MEKYEEYQMARLWAKIIVKHRIQRQATVDADFQDVKDALTRLCAAFDVPRPMWLPKHEREYESFRRTAFLPEHFIEEVPFQKLEIEFLDDESKARRSKDPRNEF
jgi:hypothetical protein